MIKLRILTGLILIGVMLGGLFYLPPMAFLALLGLFTLVGVWEWGHLFRLEPLEIGALMGALLAVAGLNGLFLFPSDPEIFIVCVLGMSWWAVAILLVLAFKGQTALPSKTSGVVWSLMLFCPFWFGLTWLMKQPPMIALSLLLLVWTADTAAFFGGKFFGKHKLCPLVSPKKTWEGFAAGLIATQGVGFLLYQFALADQGAEIFKSPLSWGLAVALLFLLAVFGDLFESLIKRVAQSKDSGTLLPGHGGVLDRIDSLLPTVPAYVLLLAVQV